MNTYINLLIGLLLGLIIWNIRWSKIREGLSISESKCSSIRDSAYDASAAIVNLQNKLKSLQEWQSSIVNGIKINTDRNSVNRDNIKRTAAIAKNAANAKEAELNKGSEGLPSS